MKQISLKRALLFAVVVASAVSGSVEWSNSEGPSLSVASAQARIGRPATPLSVAGVARRTTRRAIVGGAAVGAATVGAAGAYCHRVLVNGVWVCR
ncbi:MAG: hypothetical protein E6G85_11950 [Alphaproteobacteria bacterium]|nr:MAG: hypothetical protein E6G85_11950 [Alphaproteobacteria bacterium]